MSTRHDGELPEPVLSEEDDWFRTPFQDPAESGEVMWEDEPEAPPRKAGDGLGQRQAIVVLASIAAVVVIGGGILLVRAIGGSGGGTATPVSTSHTTTPAATTPTDTTPATTTPTTTTPSTTAVPTDAVLRPGSSGESVVTLQKALTELGYEPGAADGKYGPSTTAAVTAFQKAAGLTEDGIAGPKTLEAINAGLANG